LRDFCTSRGCAISWLIVGILAFTFVLRHDLREGGLAICAIHFATDLLGKVRINSRHLLMVTLKFTKIMRATPNRAYRHHMMRKALDATEDHAP